MSWAQGVVFPQNRWCMVKQDRVREDVDEGFSPVSREETAFQAKNGLKNSSMSIAVYCRLSSFTRQEVG